MSEQKAISNQNKKWETMNANLKRLGASLMFPLFLLAFASLILGFTYIFPREWLITQSVSKITMSIFLFFPLLVYISIIITFHNNKDKYTLINSMIFIFIILAIQYSIEEITTIDEYLFSNSVFSMIICSSVFILIDKKITKPYLWTGVGFLLSIILVPTFMFVALAIRVIGFLIGVLPFGLNAFFYGSINRLLLPLGLHSLLIPTFTYTAVGGSLVIEDSTGIVQTINGDSAIWTYMYTHGIDFELQNGSFNFEGVDYTFNLINSNSPGQYQVGFLPLTTFIFPILGISYVIFNGWEKGKMLFAATIITMCSGLTEVTEYMFLYTNIYLYILEIMAVGLSFMLCNLLHVSVWISTGWFIDIILFGVIPAMHGFSTNWYWIPVIGICIGVVFAILFNLLNKYSEKPINV